MEYQVGPEEPASVATVVAVSSVEDRAADSLPSLNDSIDPDALDTLVESWREGATGRSGDITFAFSDSLVTVDGSGRVTVEPISECKPL